MTSVKQLLDCMADRGCVSVYLKDLAENDNSKNQVYFGPGFDALNLFPRLSIQPTTSGSKKTPIFKAGMDFYWLTNDGEICPAPNAQLIFYPQYPEVRFSGFLKGCKNAPSGYMRERLAGRKLFLGVTASGTCYGHVVAPDTSLANEVDALKHLPMVGVFKSLTRLLLKTDSREQLKQALRTISSKEWIKSKRLDAKGGVVSCNAPNCGGYTLEAELGIIPNGVAEPDYLGWEVKQHKVSNFRNIEVGVITLMTPEPTRGFYVDEGVIPFVKKFGYPDRNGRPDRMNFGGVHKAGQAHPLTGLTLQLVGFDSETRKITDSGGGVALVSSHGEVASMWGYAGLMEHWNKKHAQAVYVPSLAHKKPCLEYSYGPEVRMGIGTNFLMLLEAFLQQTVYYDPGIKVENISTHPSTKRRSQFRIKSKNLASLYSEFSTVNLFD